MASDRFSDKLSFFARWSRVSLRAQGVAVLVFPLAMLFATLVAIYWADGYVRNAEVVVGYAYGARSEIMHLHGSLLAAETAGSGYQATREVRFQTAAQAAQGAVQVSVGRLPGLVGDTRVARTELAQIQNLVSRELDLLRRMPDAPAAGIAEWNEREKQLMAELQAQLDQLSLEEERIYNEGRYQRDLARQKLFRTVMACGILGPLGALFIHLLVAGRLVRRIRQLEENARRLAHGLPLEPFPAGTDEVAALARQLEDAAYLLHDRERDMRESERRYRDLFNQAPIPYEETDRNGVVTRFNQAVCTLLKCSPDQAMGRYAWHFVAPDQQDAFRAAMLERIATGKEAALESEYMLDDGSRISVEIRENPILNDQGIAVGMCRSLVDVTERNLASMAARKVEQYAMELRNKNEQLGRALNTARSATEAKSRFLASVSHELRTPLNGIIGFSEMMHDGRLGPVTEEQREVMSDILSSARHLLQLINDILDLTKVEAGHMEFRPEHCVLGLLVGEVRDIIRPLAEKKNIHLSLEVPDGLVADIDPGRFKQVLYNYLSNAVKFTGPDGSVSVRLSSEGDTNFRLEVADTGSGISPTEMSRLFQEFQQLPNSRKAEQGTGLGLALTRHIVEAQGGTVAVRSELGRGSVFSAVLPLSGDCKNGNDTE